MKRVPLRQRTLLKRKTEIGKPRSRLRPISEKKRRQKAEDVARSTAEGAAFKRAIKGERCVVCKRSEAEAMVETGYGHHAHHAVSQERLKKLGLRHRLWDPGNAVCVCEEPCHRQETSGKRRVLRGELPARVFRFVRDVEAEDGIDLARYLPAA